MAVILRVGDVARQKGLNVQALADRAHVAYGTAHALYNGTAKRIDLETLDRICDALEVAPGDLLVKAENKA